MNPYSLFPLTNLLVSLAMLSYLLSQKSRDKKTNGFLAFIVLTTIWSLMSFLLWEIIPDKLMMFWLKLNSINWLGVSILFLNFIYLFLEKKSDLIFKIFLGSSAASILLSFFTNLINTGYENFYWGVRGQHGTLYQPAVILSVILPMLYVIFLLARAAANTESKTARIQANLLLGGAATSIGLGLITSVVIPEVFKIKDFIDLSSSSSIILAGFVLFAMTHYKFLNVGIEEAALDLFNYTSEGLLILDQEAKISQVNPLAKKWLGLEEKSEIELQKISAGDLPCLRPYLQESSSTEIRLDVENKKLFILISSSEIIKNGEKIGEILRLSDISEIKTAEEKLKQANFQLEERIQERTGRLSDSIKRLEKLVGNVRSSTDHLNDHSQQVSEISAEASRISGQISQSMQRIAADAHSQSLSVEDMVTKIENIASAIEEVKETSSRGYEIAQKVSGSVEDSESALREMISKMNEIRSTSESSARMVEEVSQISAEIETAAGKIVSIANETNLLSLNATIEAAHAGEEGKGFAVVAQAIGKLAENSTISAKEIQTRLKNMHQIVGETQNTIRANSQKVNEGVQISGTLSSVLSSILELVRNMSSEVTHISRLSARQAEHSTEIVTLIHQIENISEENNHQAGQVLQATQDSDRQMLELNSSAQALADMALSLSELIGEMELKAE